MGEVYRARDSRLNRDVAIKILPAAVAGDTTRMARFQREAQLLASLSHRHIAAVYGLEESPDGTALVMELVEGHTLAERIAQGPIPLGEALALARQIGDALEAAHEKGIVHRDLKPANIKLTPDGQIKVLDFGLAKAFESDSASSDLTNSPTLTLEATRTGVIMGTAGYMSPEQARGKPVDKRADIWAFGVVLLEMLTGKSMFQGETVSDTLAAVLRADIDWAQLPATVPPPVRRLLQRCLERDPKRRLRDIGDAWIEIDSPAAAAAVPPVKSISWLPWIAAAVLGGVGIAWGVWQRSVIAPRVPIHSILADKGTFVLPAVSHDGTQVLLTEAHGASLNLSARMLDENQMKPIPGSEGMFYADFSPDGQWIAAYTGTSITDWAIRKIQRGGGTPIKIASGSSPMGLTWGDDGTIVYSGGGSLMTVSSSGGSSRTLLAPDNAKGESGFVTPHFLPGSRALLFTLLSASSVRVAVLNLKTGHYRVVVDNARDARYVSCGYLLYARGETVFAAPFDSRSLAVTGPDTPVIEKVASNGSRGVVAEYSVSDNGVLVYSEGEGSRGATTLGWVDRQGHTQTVSDSQPWGTGRLSPDGRRVANELYTGDAADDQPGDIWIFELERHTKTRLTFGGVNANPIWTPDGGRITFSSLVDGHKGLYSVIADGSSKPELLVATDDAAAADSWSADQSLLFYHQTSPGKPRTIWVLPVSAGVAGKPSPLHEAVAFESDAQISPDGHWLAYISAETGKNEAYLQPYPGHGGKELVSTGGADSVRWSRDGRELFYLSRNGEGALMAVEAPTKPQLHIGLPVALAKTMFGTTWDPAPDGKRLLVELIPGQGESSRTVRGVSDWFEELKRRVPIRR